MSSQGEHHVNLFSEECDENLISEEYKEVPAITGKSTQNLFEERPDETFPTDPVINRHSDQSYCPSTVRFASGR